MPEYRIDGPAGRRGVWSIWMFCLACVPVLFIVGGGYAIWTHVFAHQTNAACRALDTDALEFDKAAPTSGLDYYPTARATGATDVGCVYHGDNGFRAKFNVVCGPSADPEVANLRGGTAIPQSVGPPTYEYALGGANPGTVIGKVVEGSRTCAETYWHNSSGDAGIGTVLYYATSNFQGPWP